LTRTGRDTIAQDDALVSVVREFTQRQIIRAGASVPATAVALTADADHSLAGGHPDTAVRQLDRAYWLAVFGR
jgi:beta-glucosidase